MRRYVWELSYNEIYYRILPKEFADPDAKFSWGRTRSLLEIQAGHKILTIYSASG